MVDEVGSERAGEAFLRGSQASKAGHLLAIPLSIALSSLGIRIPILLTLMGIGFFYGLYSEGLDRLWVAHLLESFNPPLVEAVGPVVWFGSIKGILSLASLLTTEVVRRRVDVERSAPAGRILMLNGGLIALLLAVFGIARVFWVALVLYCLVGALRSIIHPLYSTWFNLRIDDAKVRATMLSVVSQVDAIG